MGSSNQVEDIKQRHGTAHKHDPNFRGPTKNRGCTDILCLLLLIAFVVGWVIVGVFAIQWGNPMILLYPSNSKGEICGQGDYRYCVHHNKQR